MSIDLNGILEFNEKTGLKIYNKAEIRDDLKNIVNESMGVDFILQEGTEFYSFIDLLAGSLADMAGACQEVYNALGFISASGVTLDNVVSLAGITRKPEEASYVDIVIDGYSEGYEALPANTIIQDANGGLWKSRKALICDTKGSYGDYKGTARFYAIGDNSTKQYISAYNNSQDWIIKTTHNTQARYLENTEPSVFGNAEETDAQLRVRYALALFSQSTSTSESIKTKLLEETGIDYVYIVQNAASAETGSYEEYSYNMPQHSIWVIVSGENKSSWSGISSVLQGTSNAGAINFSKTSSSKNISGTTYNLAAHSIKIGANTYTYQLDSEDGIYYKYGKVYDSGNQEVGSIDLEREVLIINDSNYSFSYSSDDSVDKSIANKILMYKSLGCITSGGADNDFANRDYDSENGTGLISVVTNLEDEPDTQYRVYFSRASKKPCAVNATITVGQDYSNDADTKENIINRVKLNIIEYINNLGINNDVLYSGVVGAIYKVITDSKYVDYVFDAGSVEIGPKNGSMQSAKVKVDIYEYANITEDDINIEVEIQQ